MCRILSSMAVVDIIFFRDSVVCMLVSRINVNDSYLNMMMTLPHLTKSTFHLRSFVTYCLDGVRRNVCYRLTYILSHGYIQVILMAFNTENMKNNAAPILRFSD